MLADVSAACVADDPVLVVPWSAPDGSSAFVDLRTDPYAIDVVPEADAHPPLREALRALNAVRSPVFTAKCDAWPLDGDDCETLRMHLEAEAVEAIAEEEAQAGFACYIDLVWRERTIFASQHRQQQLLHRIARHAAAIDAPRAMLELTLRPAFVDLTGPQEGFAVTLYVKAIAPTADEAWQRWAQALRAVIALVRSLDLSGNA